MKKGKSIKKSGSEASGGGRIQPPKNKKTFKIND